MLLTILESLVNNYGYLQYADKDVNNSKVRHITTC